MRLDAQFFYILERLLHEMGKDNYKGIIQSEMKSFFNPEIRIGMWGQFSCGKSSFINALIGKKLLPVNILELTSMVTEVCFGDQEKIILNPEEDNIQLPFSEELATIAMAGIHSWDDLKPSMKEALNSAIFEQNLALFKQLKNPLNKVKLLSPAEILKTGLIFVDLPGLSGADDHSKLSAGKISDCEMILYLNAPSRPIDSHDWEIIKKLKLDGKNKVVFGVRTKSDDLFKNFYAESKDKKTDEEIYDFFKEEFKKEMKDVPFDGYFLVSPLALIAISEARENFSEAVMRLQQQHRNKFRFLRETSKIEIISGHKYFKENFFYALESKREEAKKRRVNTTISALLSRINQEILSDMHFVTSSKKLSEQEKKEAKKSLDKIKEKFIALKDIRMKFEQMMDYRLREVIAQVCSETMNSAVNKLNLDRTFQDPEHVINTILELFQAELKAYMEMPDFQEKIRLIIVSCFESYRNSLADIEDLLDKFSKELLHIHEENASLKDLDLTKSNFGDINISRQMASLKVSSNFAGVVGGFVGEFILDRSLETAMDSVIGSFAGFGMGTIVFGALKGLSSGRGMVGGIIDGISNMFNGILAILGNKSAEANLLLNSLKSSSQRSAFSKKLADQALNPIHSSIKNIVATDVAKALDKQNTTQLIWSRFASEEKKIEILFNNKEKDFKQREEDLKILIEKEKAFINLLNQYGLGETKLKKVS